MSKIKPLATIQSMSGKVCGHSDMYFRTNKVTGKTFTAKLCYPYTGEASQLQEQTRSRFAKVTAAVRTRLNELSGNDREALEKAYKSQHKIGSLFGYAMHKWDGEYGEDGDLIAQPASGDPNGD